MLRKLALLSFVTISFISLGQRGKHLACTVSALNTQLNSYIDVTANATAGNTSITVSNNSMTNAFMTTALGPGDLVMIIQMQGASLDVDVTPTASWGGNYTVPFGHQLDWSSFVHLWGDVTAYNNAGRYEVREVRSVAGANTINLMCALTNSYTVSGHVQVVRIPRITNLVLNANTSIVPALWNGTTGGVVALEVDGTTSFGTGARISASGYGFRGGVTENATNGSPPGGGAASVGYAGSNNSMEGAEKGEGIGGFYTEYDAIYSRYCKGAPANGGGGGNNHNAGGGGGSNVGTGTYYGYGTPNPTYSAIWNLENGSMSGAPSSGGGRGGYSYATSDQNESAIGPNNAAWSGDYRRNEGGYGGHPLVAAANRLFMGGGGGAGDANSTQGILQGGSGGRGGGIVFLYLYGAVSGPAVGSGTIEANGAVGQNSNPGNTVAGANSTAKYGNDGAGGAGGAGAIVISNGTALPASINVNANGGKGGDQMLSYGNPAFTANPDNEADGPGGGGAGGQISVTSIGSATQTTTGGANGIVSIALGPYPTTNFVANFVPNGATSGASGITGTTSFFDITVSNATLCAGNSTTLTATVVGTAPGTLTWYSTQFGSTVIGTGATYTTPTLAAGTYTYYVGTCPSTFRKPVTVTVGGPTITGTAVITNATCTTGGSITGLSTSGGAPTVAITWNGVTTPGMNLTGASAGSYTVVVTDGVGCTATSGPYIIGTTGGPTINTSGLVVSNETCLGNDGSITGITASGTGLTYSWNGNSTPGANYTGLAAGNYTLTVTDNNGCSATTAPIPVGLTPGPVINASGIVVVNETCSLSNGSITGITATGTGLTYSWNGTSTPSADYTGLSAGAYTLTVTNNLGCTATHGPVNITNSAAPTLNLTNQVNVDEHCNQVDGSITGIQIVGGTPNYTVSWNSGAYSTLDISGLNSGAYSLTVTDFNGCSVSAGPFNLVDIAGPTINTSGMIVTNESCIGNDGSITGITATGTGLSYSWNLVPSATLDHTGLAAGNYNLLVQDNFGCFAIQGPIVVGGNPGPSIDASGIVVVNETCTSGNGSITGITATGTSLTYDWNGTTTVDADYMNLSAGSYTLTVTDNLGCTDTYGPVDITNSAGPTLDLTNQVNTDEHCGQADGSIVGIQIVGGTPTYTISWNSGAYSTLDISNLTAGNYTLNVTDFNGCTANAGPFNLVDLSGPVINTTNLVITDESCLGNDGAIGGITVTGTGLTYEWNNVASPLNLNNQTAGNYTLEVTDGFGCTATSGPHVIAASTPMSIDSSNMVISPAGCTMDIGSIIGVQIVGGVNPQFTWSNSSPTLNNMDLAAGTYTLTVIDDQMCSITVDFTVGNTTPPQISTAGVIYSTAHCNQNDGAINGIVITGGVEPYSYEWDGVATNNTLNLANTTGGNHTLVVTDSVGCLATVVLNVPAQAGPSIDMSGVTITSASCGLNNGEIEGIEVTGGTGAVTYAWTGSNLTSIDLFNLQAGNYQLTATDAEGCQTTSTVIVVPAGPTINADFTIAPGGVLLPGTTVTFTDNSSGSAAVSWEWSSDNIVFGNANTSSQLYPNEGTYVVTLVVENSAGCIDSISKTIDIFAELIIPNVITRNADNVNDLFEIQNLKPNTKLVVENRWGNLVYETEDYKNDWDGTDMAGELLVEGVYFYQLITVEGKLLQGNVYLLNH